MLLVVKTLHERLSDVQRIVKEEHPFECPELIALDITAGLPEYLRWVTSSSAPSQDPAVSQSPTAGAEEPALSVPPAAPAPGTNSAASCVRGFGSGS